MKVKNLNGTSDNNHPAGYVSCKEFYLARRRFWPSTCACFGCTSPAEVGAHVKKIGSYDGSWYIVPLCKYHNNQFGEELDVFGDWLEPLHK